MMRLAFFTTKCDIEEREIPEDEGAVVLNENAGMTIKVTDDHPYGADELRFSEVVKKAYATNKNFPQTDISTVIESLFNAFGLKLIISEVDKRVSIFYIRDIFRDNEVIDVFMHVTNRSIQYEKTKGVKMTYGGDEDNTSYNYSDWKRIELTDDYNGIVQGIHAYDKNLYIHTKTGNKYRVKVDEDAETKEELFPSLFEVAKFNDYIVGEKSDDETEI